MINKNIEMISWQSFYPEKTNDILQTTLDYGLNGLSINGSNIENLKNCFPIPKIYLNIDSYFAFHPPKIRLNIIKDYIRLYGQYISGINFTPVFSQIYNWNIKEVTEDFKNISDICLKYKLSSRLFIDYSFYKTHDIIYKIANLSEQSGVERICVGSFSKEFFDVADIILSIENIKKNLGYKVGIFGFVNSEDLNNYEYFKSMDKDDILFLKLKNILALKLHSV